MNAVEPSTATQNSNAELIKNNTPLFDLGNVVMTQGVSHHVNQNNFDQLLRCLSRHRCGDWGNVCEEDYYTNDESVLHGFRILSIYELDGETIWIITESDRSVTTVLFPIEY